MYIELNDRDYELIKKVSEVTLTNYELKGNLMSTESMICAIQELLWEVERLEEEKEQLEDDIRENYKKISIEEQLDEFRN